MSTKANEVKMTVTPKNDKERARLERYFKAQKFHFTVRDGSKTPAKKSEALTELEEQYKKLAKTGRFRFTKEELAEVKAGNTTREKVIKARIKAFTKEIAAAA